MPIRQWIADDWYEAIDPTAGWTLLRPSGYPSTMLALGFAVWLFGNSGANVEGVIYFGRRNARREKAHYRMSGPIAAFVLAVLEIRRDYNQYGRGDETAYDYGVSHIHDHTPAGLSQLPNG